MEEDLERMMRDALVDEPPTDADARIIAAIRMAAAARRRRRRLLAIAAAAALAVMLAGGIWQHGRHRATIAQRDVVLADESDLMLEIIDMAEPLDVNSFQVAQL